ncbi:MAG: hypothetical protein A3B25_03840 [Candidatus Ryanbacteria bacterium RIFCSPLOWO2_01_FULL_48_26]|uniref:GIY-YIG domain-containing protein n=1 Tax=Candidatus Ryanbacteria bacterium RIFCSPLOWO2_01_FULL_48_26 TaxID=1802126 RepID=A0A1G2GSX4_9BACT|nr:MAG: hypothetical protein A3B25_03840 [Candidatus Ryanbacteria bacterium RIFCSPLOWO2_01_FULL_48_26]
MSNMKPCVYILKSLDGKYYVGSTTDLERRLKQHRFGYTATTHRMENPKLVFAQKYETLAQARTVERKLKRLKRKDYIEKIICDKYIKLGPS